VGLWTGVLIATARWELNIAEILFICQSINQINYFLAINIATEHFFHISLQPAAL
jgi:hypothetical protein